ncbi:protease inhibitor [Streptomyces sioyaensis]|uniref:Protease inhibitor n=1 Tax=Streptomyces sioyaensis TaxID=67364 RepID=A0A4Q1RCG2_9ACTN|nr:SSI family serine proteinase inhibitor [Streptomyces sioyaensis]MBM4796712.1 protease inhibitor [Streptomyces sioyaensis]RXS71544.1 protease inhibitor [Streptomyces sioyaensis]
MPVSRGRRSARTAVLAALSTALLGTLGVGPAGADEPPVDQGLQLTVSGSGNTWVRGVRLSCPDTYRRHPHALAACNALTWARGDLDALPGEPHSCTREYDPVTVSATGTWRGSPVNWRKEFPNACTMDSATGPVFRF